MNANTISLNLDELTPTTLAAIIANLSRNLSNGTTRQEYGTRIAMINAYDALIGNCGEQDAGDLLAEAGADPDELDEIDAAMEAAR